MYDVCKVLRMECPCAVDQLEPDAHIRHGGAGRADRLRVQALEWFDRLMVAFVNNAKSGQGHPDVDVIKAQ